MKILQVLPALQQGGVERSTIELANYIIKQGGKSLVASSGGKLVDEVIATGSQHFTFSLKSKNPVTMFLNIFHLIKLIKDEGVDIVHARSRAPAWSAYFAAKYVGLPFITTFHGTYGLGGGFIKKWYNSVMVRGVYTISNSKFIKKHILDNYKSYGINPNNIIVAQRGFDPKHFCDSLANRNKAKEYRLKLGIKDGLFTIIMPGRITRWKGQMLFIKALAKVIDLNWQAIIVGNCDVRQQPFLTKLKEQVTALGLSNRVVFTPSSNFTPYYIMADIAVSASIEPEAFGRVAIEAQALGCPVVATAHGGSLETVKDGETGFLVNPINAETMAKILRRVISDKVNLQEIADNGRIWVHNNFTVEDMCAKEFSAYTQALEKK